MKSSHRLFSYKHPHGQRQGGICGVSILQTGEDMAVVVLTELPTNPGISVTNAFEHIAMSVKEILLPEIAASEIIWVERYLVASLGFDEGHGKILDETFDLVRLQVGPYGYAAPSWSPIGRNRSQGEFWRVLFMSEWPLCELPDFAGKSVPTP